VKKKDANTPVTTEVKKETPEGPLELASPRAKKKNVCILF